MVNIEFQFHYGAILGESWVNQDNDQVISIPLWCNFGESKGRKKGRDPISIPLWCNFGKMPPDMLYNMLDISIPLWCNFGCIHVLDPVKEHLFQFHYGAILGSFLMPKLHPAHSNFNSTMVQFWEGSSRLRVSLSRISIPLWCNFGIQCPRFVTLYYYFNSTMVQFWVFVRCAT